MKYDLNHSKRYFRLQNDDGELVEYETLFTFECKETSKKYIVYTDNNVDEEGYTITYASEYTMLDGNETNLTPIESEYEWSIIEEILDEIQNEVIASEKEDEDFDAKKYIEELERKYANDEAEERYYLGVYYITGSYKGTPLDPDEGESLLRSLAQNGSVEAEMILALCLEKGKFGRIDNEEAFSFYTSAAEKGNLLALYYIGDMYLTGTGTQQNTQKAIECFFKAANLNEPYSQVKIGDFYYLGEHGFKQDYQKAVSWYEKAAMQRDPEAQYKLRYCYNNGLGVTKDLGKAVGCFTLAAEENIVDAQ